MHFTVHACVGPHPPPRRRRRPPVASEMSSPEPTKCAHEVLLEQGALKYAECANNAKALLKAQDYAGAAREVDELLKRLGALQGVGKEAHEHDHQQGAGKEANEHDHDCEHDHHEHDHDGPHHRHDHPHHHPEAGPDVEMDVGYDVIVVGAGAAGIGCATTLTQTFGLDRSRVLLVERGEAVGQSFREWPDEMRFISPSFNQQGWTSSFDLNSIAHKTSPAYTLHAEHPSGKQYADYLSFVAESFGLIVKLSTRVTGIARVGGVFEVRVRAGGDGGVAEETLRARFVVWAAGEFQYPRETSEKIPGAELCVHNSRVRSWASLPGDDFVLIGGYESGVDAAVNLARAGKHATVLASTATWNVQTEDPSTELAPYTAERLRQVTAAGFSPRPKLLAPLRVKRVERAQAGGYNVIATWKAAEHVERPTLRQPLGGNAEAGGAKSTADTTAGIEGSELVLHTPQPPVLCTGFEGSVASSARDLFDLADESDVAKG